MRTHTTPVGTFTSGNDYRDELIMNGYTDWGWINGWSKETQDKYNKTIDDHSIESLQWNRSGSDCTYVCHELKLFCSVDMGD